MTFVHAGRAGTEEGSEHARGASAFDDWADVQLFLTKDHDGRRFLRTDGRMDEDLPESRLDYDPVTRILTLACEGESRATARARAAEEAAVKAVDEEPGINTRELRDAVNAEGISDNAVRDKGISEALRKRRVHRHPAPRNAQAHYPGPPHPEVSPLCPWRPSEVSR